MICVIDYGAGNLSSVSNALKFIGAEHIVSCAPDDVMNADRVILPGVGAFGDAMASLRERKLEEPIRAYIDGGKPFLGICLGLQLLFEESEESPGVKGLSVYKGCIRRFPDNMTSPSMSGGNALKIPHIGWNSISVKDKSSILPDGEYVYFVHSYYLQAEDRTLSAATCDYGITFDAAISQRNVTACQFHPEKSGAVGIEILRKFTNS